MIIHGKISKLYSMNFFLFLILLLISIPFGNSNSDSIKTVRNSNTETICIPQIITETKEICQEICTEYETSNIILPESERNCLKYETVCRNNTIKKTVNNCKKLIYSGAMFIQDSKEDYKPMNEVVDVSYENNLITISWLDNIVIMSPYIKLEGKKYKIKDMEKSKKVKDKPTKDEINFKTNINKNKYDYYYTHTMDTKLRGIEEKVTDFGYEIIKTNTNCIMKGTSLICEDVEIDFSDAVNKQNFTLETEKIGKEVNAISLKSKKGKTSLSYIDPTIQLSSADSEVLEDCYVCNDTGWDLPLYAFDNQVSRAKTTIRRAYIKYNNTLPTNANIIDANLNLYTESKLDGYVKVYQVYNQTWLENEVKWSNQPCGTGFDDSSQCNFTVLEDYYSPSVGSFSSFDVTKAIQNDVSNSRSNSSFAIIMNRSEYSLDINSADENVGGFWDSGDLVEASQNFTATQISKFSIIASNLEYMYNWTIRDSRDGTILRSGDILRKGTGTWENFTVYPEIIGSVGTYYTLQIVSNETTVAYTLDSSYQKSNIISGVYSYRTFGDTWHTDSSTDMWLRVYSLDSSYYEFSSKEDATSSQRPYMNITYLHTLNTNISDCTVLDSPDITYYLDSDIINTATDKCMDVTANNITLDCQGHIIDAIGVVDRGINIDSKDDFTLKNCIVTDFNYGVYGVYSNRISVLDSTIANNTYFDIQIDPSAVSTRCDSTISNVTGSNNNPIVYYNSTVTIENWNNNVSEIMLCNADNSLIDNLTLNNGQYENNGILLYSDNVNITNSNITNTTGIFAWWQCDYLNVEDTYFENNMYCIYGATEDYFNIDNITSKSNDYGILIYNGDYCNISNSVFRNSSTISVYYYLSSDYNTIRNCSFTEDIVSIGFYHNSNYNYVYNNSITDLKDWGGGALYFWDVNDYNYIYNNFLNTTANTYSVNSEQILYLNITKQPGTRIYTEGHEIGGNFWAKPDGTGFSETCADQNADGFCDSSYQTEINNIDYLPLSTNYSTVIITLTSPEDNYFSDSSSETFTCSATSNVYLTNITLYHNITEWKANETSIINNQKTNSSSFTINNIPDGEYLWNCLAYDNNSLYDWNGNRTITIDTTNPSVNYTSPTPADSTRKIANSETINVSYYDLNFETCIFNWQGVNETFTSSNSINFWETKATTDGTTYTFQAFCNDLAGNINDTELRTFRENAKPTLASASINDSSPTDLVDLLCVNGTTADTDNDTVSFTYEWYNNSIAQSINNSVLASGNTTSNDNWYCSMIPQDSYEDGTIRYSSTVSIATGFLAPSINSTNATTALTNINSTSTFPTNNNSWINLSVNFYDSNADEEWTVYFCNTTDLTSCKTGNYFCKSSAITDKTYSCRYNLYNETETTLTYYPIVEDNNSLSSGSSTSNTLTINYPPTTLNLTYPSNNSYININHTLLNFTSTDSDTLNYTIFNSTGQLYNGTNAYFNWTNLTDGIYYWKGYVTDQHNYQSFVNSTTHKFTIDTLNPILTVSSPTSTTYYLTSISISNTASDTNLNSCFYYIKYKDSGAIYKTNTTITCDSTTAITLPVYSGGYTVYVLANDSAGNLDTKEINLTIATAPSGGSGGSGSGTTETIFVEAGNFTLETEFGSSYYNWIMIPDSTKKGEIIITNLGTIKKTFSLECIPLEDNNSDICSYVSLERSSEIEVYAGEKVFETIKFNVTIPPEIEYGEILGFGITATDNEGHRSKPLTVAIEIGRLIGHLSVMFEKMFSGFYTVPFSSYVEESEDVTIPVIIPLIFSTVIFGIVFTWFLSKIKFKNKLLRFFKNGIGVFGIFGFFIAFLILF